MHVLLRREGWTVNKKVVYRIYTEEGLTMRRKRPRRRLRSALHRRAVLAAVMPDQRWSVDFVADQLADGAKIRALAILDHPELGLGLRQKDLSEKTTGERLVGMKKLVR